MDKLKITLCNQALMLISKARIQDLAEKTAEARACREAFASVLAELLRSANWNFAKKRKSLALLREEGGFFVYQKPKDCVFLSKLFLPAQSGQLDLTAKFELIGEEIYCRQAQARLEYISKDLTLDRLDPLFQTAFVHRLAAEIAKELTGDAQMQANHFRLYLQFLAEAKEKNAQEGGLPKRMPNPYAEDR